MNAPNFANLLLEIESNIATVTINRPRALNSLNTETLKELGFVFDFLKSRDSVAGVILSGAGDKAFVAGADIAELTDKNPLTAKEFSLLGQAVFNQVELLPKPVIAAVNGFALGGGCELAMACHIRAASFHARFGQPEVGLGLIPGFGGTQRLPRLVGKGRALEMLLSGGMIDADEAYRIGLANVVLNSFKVDAEGKEFMDEKGRRVFDRDLFMKSVFKMMEGILEKGPLALKSVIEAVNRGFNLDLPTGLLIEADLFSNIYATEDAHEGMTAFLEKRKAEFTNR